jgi:hypothetical protein
MYLQCTVCKSLFKSNLLTCKKTFMYIFEYKAKADNKQWKQKKKREKKNVQ